MNFRSIINLILLFLFVFNNQANAQELTETQIEAIKKDDVVLLKKSTVNYNECFQLKESSYSLLALSIKMDKVQIFDFLLKNGADLNKICDSKTPLMFAAKYGKEDFAKKLLASGADKSISNSKGMQAKDYAQREGFGALSELLK